MAESVGRRALIVVENCSVPFDRRVWREAKTLHEAGWHVCVISPKGGEYSKGGSSVSRESAVCGGPLYVTSRWSRSALRMRWRTFPFQQMNRTSKSLWHEGGSPQIRSS